MNRRIDIIVAISVIAFAALHIAASCSMVDYTYHENEKIPTDSDVSFHIDWSSIQKESESGTVITKSEIPAQMYIAMSRIMNSVHYVYVSDHEGKNLRRLYASRSPEQETDDTLALLDSVISGLETMPDSLVASDTNIVLNGTYYVMAFNYDAGNYYVSAMNQFVRDSVFSLRDLYAEIPALSDDERMERYPHHNPRFNPNFSYILNAGPLFMDARQVVIPYEGDNISLTPKPLTQRLTFQIDMLLETGVSISRMYADISGVVGKVELMSGEVYDDTTYKVCFDFKEYSRGEETKIDNDTTTYQLIEYRGSVDVLGLFPSDNETYRTGKGIINLTVSAKAGKKERRFYAGLNLKTQLEQAQLLKLTDDGLGYRIAQHDSTEVLIPATELVIKKSLVMSGDGQGTVVWEYDENNDIEIEM